jgi:hypothetical protein
MPRATTRRRCAARTSAAGLERQEGAQGPSPPLYGHRSVHGRDDLVHELGQLLEWRGLLLLVGCRWIDRWRGRWVARCRWRRRWGRRERQLPGRMRSRRLPTLREEFGMPEGGHLHGLADRRRELLLGGRGRRRGWPWRAPWWWRGRSGWAARRRGGRRGRIAGRRDLGRRPSWRRNGRHCRRIAGRWDPGRRAPWRRNPGRRILGRRACGWRSSRRWNGRRRRIFWRRGHGRSARRLMASTDRDPELNLVTAGPLGR